MKQTTNKYLNNLMKTMDALVDKRMSNAGFDRTIKCTVQSCEDEATGKYKVKFQDQSFYAFATDTSKKIRKNTLVYVLIPNNDMRNIKQIIGTEEQLGSDYIDVTMQRQQYQIVSPNLYNNETVLQIKSTQSESSYANHSSISFSTVENGLTRNFNNQSNEDLKILFLSQNRPDFLKITGYFKTNLPKEKQQKVTANYGIAIQYQYGNDSNGYVIDELQFSSANFLGNPYNFSTNTLQEIYVPLPERFQDWLLTETRTDSPISTKILLFKENFSDSGEEELDYDIFCSNFSIQLVKKIDSNLLTNYLFLNSINNNFILSEENDTIFIQASLNINGTLATSGVSYFWGIEDIGVNRSTEYAQNINLNGSGFNQHLGYGWSCLNKSLYVNDNRLMINKSLLQTDRTNFKCAAVYKGTVYTNTVEILNSDPSYLIIFTCDNTNGTLRKDGKIISADDIDSTIGNIPTGFDFSKVCSGFNINTAAANPQVNINSFLLRKNASSNKYIFEDSNGNSFSKTWSYFISGEDYYHQMITTTSHINAIITDLSGKTGQYKITYAQGTRIYGTGSFEIQYQNIINTVPHLQIINGSQTFLYSETGQSPANEEYFTNPQIIKPISFNIFDGDSILTADSFEISSVQWKIPQPQANTLLDIERIMSGCGLTEEQKQNIRNNPVGGYYIIEGLNGEGQLSNNIINLPIFIEDSYSIQKTDNQIILQVKYKDIIYTAETAFVFTHQGEIGTNGTEMVCKIYLYNGTAPVEDSSTPIINIYNLNSGAGAPTVEYSWDSSTLDNFQVICKLFRNGDSIADSTLSTFDDSYNIEWSIYKNLYKRTGSSTIEDISWLEVLDTDKNNKIGTFFINYTDASFSDFLIKSITQQNNDNLEASLVDADRHPVNIIKCTLTEKETKKVFIATLPVIFILHALPKSSNSNKIELLNFDLRQIMYNNNGELPSYNFSNNIQIQVSNTLGFNNSNLTLLGSYYAETEWHAAKILTSSSDTVYSYESRTENNVRYRTYNIASLRAVDKYNSLAKNTGLVLGIAGNGISCIVLPIHAYLNTYGLSALNGWDGNALSIDDEGQFLLTPQVGAGKKNSDNTFTGVVIGTVKNTSLLSSAKSEHTGLFTFAEGKQSIFLDAETGKAEFGTTQSGKIVIDPENDLVIQTGQYQDVGTATGGLKINFSNEHEIRFGTGNFIVDKYGHVTARYINVTGEVHATSGTIGEGNTYGSHVIVIKDGAIGNSARLGNDSDFTVIKNAAGFYLGPANLVTGNNIYTRGYALSMGGWDTSFTDGRPTSPEDMYRHCYFLVLGNGQTYIRNGVFTNTTLYGNTQITQGYLKAGVIQSNDIKGAANSLDLYASTSTSVLSSADLNSVNIRGNSVHLSMNNLYVNDEVAYNTDFKGKTQTLYLKQSDDTIVTLKFLHGILII